jgi:hypothetical protein
MWMRPFLSVATAAPTAEARGNLHMRNANPSIKRLQDQPCLLNTYFVSGTKKQALPTSYSTFWLINHYGLPPSRAALIADLAGIGQSGGAA